MSGPIARAFGLALDVANKRHPISKLVPPALILADALLCALVVWKIPYTEIDWVAYMEQVAQYIGGERDYTKIEGGTGPLVYPAAHVYIYTGLYHLTDGGKNILLAQKIFAGLYLATLSLVMACYWDAKAPPYVFPLLILSKRLHSIFMLRCFNDCFAAFFFWLSLWLLQRRRWELGGLAFGLGIGVKMSLLLSLPGVGVVLFLGWGFAQSIQMAIYMAGLQVILGFPFLAENPAGYLGRAFELTRKFLFRWTVNWRFVGDDVFSSPGFAVTLLAGHAAVLVAFAVHRWLRPARKPLMEMVAPVLFGAEPPLNAQEAAAASRLVTPQYVLTTVLTANVVGLLFSRSLHYQFYALLAWSAPFLLWRSGIHPALQYALWLGQEWAWNVFPSTRLSSSMVVAVMAMTVRLAWRVEKGGEEQQRQPVGHGRRKPNSKAPEGLSSSLGRAVPAGRRGKEVT